MIHIIQCTDIGEVWECFFHELQKREISYNSAQLKLKKRKIFHEKFSNFTNSAILAKCRGCLVQSLPGGVYLRKAQFSKVQGAFYQRKAIGYGWIGQLLSEKLGKAQDQAKLTATPCKYTQVTLYEGKIFNFFLPQMGNSWLKRTIFSEF